MEELSVKGLIVKDVDFGENDKLLTIITEDKGKLTVTVKGGRSLKNKFISVAEAFTYGTFGVRKKSKFFYLFDADVTDDFYPIREDLVKMSLASYICDVANELALEEVADEALLKLTLNALYALAYKDYDTKIIKAAYEFKAASISGFMPEISCCSVCGREPEDDSFVNAASGTLICSDCMTKPTSVTGIDSSSIVLPLTASALSALRYLEEAPIQRFLSFRLTGDAGAFTNFCEKYLACHLEKELYTLSFYKSVLNV